MASRFQRASASTGTAAVSPSAPGTGAATSCCAELRRPPAWRFLKENGGKKSSAARLSSDDPGPVSPPPRSAMAGLTPDVAVRSPQPPLAASWAALAADDDGSDDDDELAPMTPLTARPSSPVDPDPPAGLSRAGGSPLADFVPDSQPAVVPSGRCLAGSVRPSPAAAASRLQVEPRLICSVAEQLASSHADVDASSMPATRTCAGREDAATDGAAGGWQLVASRKSPRRPALPAPAFKPSPIPRWLLGRCCRCIARGHRASSCREPIRCSRCLLNGHKSRGCKNQWRPLSFIDGPTVPPPPLPRPAAAPSQAALRPGRGWEVPPPRPLLQPAAPRAAMPRLGDPSREETELLHAELRDCLARVERVLGRAEVALAKLEVVPPVSSLSELQIESSVGEEGSLYGHFSPRATSCPSSMPVLLSSSGRVAIDEVVTPVLQIMPELQELCGETASPLSMVLPKEMGKVMSVGDEVAEVGALAPNFEAQLQGSPLPCGQLEAPESIVSVVTVADDVLAVVSMRDKVTSVGAEVDEVGTLAPHSEAPKSIRSPVFDREGFLASIDEAVFKKKLCRLLASLEAASPGSGKMIACLLAKKASTDKIKKVKKALRSIGKKSGAIGKASAAA